MDNVQRVSQFDVLVVGAGAAGLAAATSAAQQGASVLVVEREAAPGGILSQCIHNGFGLHRYGEELTGPEYAAREIASLHKEDDAIQVLTDTAVLALKREGKFIQATLVSAERGMQVLTFGAVVLACGCRERSRGEIGIPGTRPAGVYTAGCAQKLCNIDGIRPGSRVVILGSGDIGLIMARRMTWEGAKVLCVCELASEPGGLRRNIVQCLDDNNIPLLLSTTVTAIKGSPRLEAVELSDVDPVTKQPIHGTSRLVECDALLLSVGLIPDNTLAKGLGAAIDPGTKGPKVNEHLQTSVPGLFVAGNELHVQDLVDYVSEEGTVAGISAALYALGKTENNEEEPLTVVCGEGVAQIAPQLITQRDKKVTLRLRSRARIENAQICVVCNNKTIRSVARRIVVPSEMQEIVLRPTDLEQITGELEVVCQPAERR